VGTEEAGEVLTSIRQGRGRQAGFTLVETLISMIILGIITTMIIIGWVNLQRASASALRTNHARAALRDAMSRVSFELRGAQPTALPTASPSAAPLLLTLAQPMEVQFFSAFNSVDANLDGSGISAVRPTRLWLDPDLQTAPWNPACRTLYWQRDMDRDGSFDGAGDRSIVLARNVANDIVDDTAAGTGYTAIFVYGYRETVDDPVLWTDNSDSSLDLSTVVAVSVRLIIDKKMGGAPSYADLTTTVRLRNAGGE
jgi:prepilin-type N-terminal cleavage/methylation domain-containing protein